MKGATLSRSHRYKVPPNPIMQLKWQSDEWKKAVRVLEMTGLSQKAAVLAADKFLLTSTVRCIPFLQEHRIYEMTNFTRREIRYSGTKISHFFRQEVHFPHGIR